MKLVLLLALTTILLGLLFVAESPAAEENLVENGTFDQSGEDAVPKWQIRRVARLTEFRTEGGRLVAERKPGSSPSDDAVLQMLFLPANSRAIRVRLDAEAERLIHAEVSVRFVRRDGGSAGSRKVFHLAGTRKRRTYDKDLLLPEDTKNVEIAIRMCAEGRLVVDDVDVRPVDPGAARGEARVVELRGAWLVRGLETGRVGGRTAEAPENLSIEIPVPPPAGTQAPCRLEVRVEPSNLLVNVTARRESGLDAVDVVVMPPPREGALRISVVARVVVTEREGFRDLPESAVVSPARHLGPRIQAFAATRRAPWLVEGAKRAAEGAGDLFALAEGVRRVVRGVVPASDGRDDPTEGAGNRLTASGRANLAAEYFRMNEVPARAIALVRIGDPSTLEHGVLAYQKELGWLRFGLDAGGPPLLLPFAEHVLLRAGPAEGFIALEDASEPDTVQVEHEVIEGPSGGTIFSAREIGSLTLPEGAGPDLIASVVKAWDRACREFDPETASFAVDPGRLSLGGRARKLSGDLAEILSE